MKTPEMKKIDNMINKLNKRAFRMAQKGLQSSEAYKGITAAISRMEGAYIAQEVARVFPDGIPQEGYGNAIKRPVKYVNVTTPAGELVKVPQISRSNAVMAFASSSNFLTEAEAAGTATRERNTMRDYLETAMGGDVTDEDIEMAMNSDWLSSDMLTYVWDYLYGLKQFDDVQKLFDEVTGKKYESEAEQDKYNSIAVSLYAKYGKKNVDMSSIRQRPLNKQQKAFVWGGFDKISGTYGEGEAQKAASNLAQSIESGDVVGQVDAARSYLQLSKATAGYNDSINRYKPTNEEIQNLIDWMKGGK